MERHRLLLALVMLSVTALGAGCFGPDEDPATTVEEETETTPGGTVEAGATPTGVTATPTLFETADDLENATEEGGGDEGGAAEETTAEE